VPHSPATHKRGLNHTYNEPRANMKGSRRANSAELRRIKAERRLFGGDAKSEMIGDTDETSIDTKPKKAK
jgi:hypothetical protein